MNDPRPEPTRRLGNPGPTHPKPTGPPKATTPPDPQPDGDAMPVPFPRPTPYAWVSPDLVVSGGCLWTLAGAA